MALTAKPMYHGSKDMRRSIVAISTTSLSITGYPVRLSRAPACVPRQTAAEGRQMALARRRLQLLHDRAHPGIAHSIEERSIECLVLDLGVDPRGTGLRQPRITLSISPRKKLGSSTA